MNFIKDIKLEEENKFNMIIEIEKGSKKKNELVEPNFEELKCVRKSLLKYPFYYGCFPQTLAGDKDPADAILLTNKKHNELDIVKVCPIVVIYTIDNGEEDNKIICIEEELKHSEKLIKVVSKFLHLYKGKKANMIIDEHIGDAKEAVAEILKAHKNFEAQNKGANKVLKVQ